MTPAERPTRESTRCLALALALVLPATAVLKISHYATVQHTRCAAHGELVHEGLRKVHTVAPSVGVHAAPVTPAHGHEHCDCEGICDRQGTLAHATPGVVLPVLAVETEARAPSFAPASSRVIYSLAPKTSPPV